MNSKPRFSQNGTAVPPSGLASWFADRSLLPIAVLAITSLAVYYNSLSNGFVFDDYAVIVENKHIRDLGKSLLSLFNNSYFIIAGGESSYRPVATLSYFLIHSFAGLNPFYYHLSSVLLHTLNVILMYLLSCSLLKDRFKALLAGLLFASHPALTEAVDCIAFNEDLLAALFFLLSLILYIKSVNQGTSGTAYFLSLLFFFCGLLSKEMAITLPLIILLYDLTFRGIKARLPSVKHAINTAKDRWRYYLGYAVTGSVYLVLRFYIIIDPADGVKPNFGNLFERLAYLPNHLFSFIKLALAPYNLNVEYVFSYPQNFFEISHLVGFATTLMLAICSFFIYRRFKTIFFGIWWFLITLLPVCNIIEIFNPFAERYLYLPIIGFCLALPMLLYSIFSRATNRAVAANLATLLVVLVITGIYSTITVARNRDWKDGLTLWSKTVKQSPNSGIAHGSLGRAYQEQGLLDKAIAEYRKTVMIMPNNFKAYYNLGVAYDQKGDINKAVENLKRSITINPAFADAHFNLANLYNKRGLTDEAIHHYRKAIDLNPNDIEARNNLGVTLALQGKVKKAIIEWQKVLEIDPANKSAQDNIAQARELLEQSD